MAGIHNKNLIQHQTDIKCHFIGKNHVCNKRFVIFLMTIFISALECHVVYPRRFLASIYVLLLKSVHCIIVFIVITTS